MGEGGLAIDARIGSPLKVEVDSNDNLYILLDRHLLRVDAITNIITTVAGTGDLNCSGDGGLAIDAGLCLPRGLAIDQDDNLFITGISK